MSEQEEHSRLPWDIFLDQIKTKQGSPDMDESELIPITSTGHGVNQKANLDYIVRACNAFPALVEALEMVKEELVFGGDWETAGAKIIAALAAAKGEA